MSSHARIQSLLSEYHDGELPHELAEVVERHLAACRDCQLHYTQLSEVANALRHLPRVDAPASLGRMIRRRIDEEVRGMVPILRGELLSSRSRPILVPALSLGALATLVLLVGLLLLDGYGGRGRLPYAGSRLSRWGLSSLGSPSRRGEMVSPRMREAGLADLPLAVETGKEGTVLISASIDEYGAVRELRVIYHSGDERIIARTLEAVRNSGFEPVRLGKEAVPANFLYLFTTTEVRPRGKQIT